jgi:hypothetical protein
MDAATLVRRQQSLFQQIYRIGQNGNPLIPDARISGMRIYRGRCPATGRALNRLGLGSAEDEIAEPG